MKNNNNIKNHLSNNSGESSISKGSKSSKFYYKNKIRKSNQNIVYFNKILYSYMNADIAYFIIKIS